MIFQVSMKLILKADKGQIHYRHRYDIDQATHNGNDISLDSFSESVHKVLSTLGKPIFMLDNRELILEDQRKYYGRFTKVSGIFLCDGTYVTVGDMTFGKKMYGGLELLSEDNPDTLWKSGLKILRQICEKSEGLIKSEYFKEGHLIRIK